jgi:menaquinone-dependent protoporphyrinogen oxidase
MEEKILIAYASKYGSTAEVAQGIGRILAEQGQTVDVKSMASIDRLDSYRAIVLGSPIYATRWLPEAEDFVNRFKISLTDLPVACFTVCMALRDGSEKSRILVAHWMKPVYEVINPVATGLFAGALEARRMGLIWHVILWLRKTPQGDFRDWPEIQTWASRLPSAFAVN